MTSGNSARSLLSSRCVVLGGGGFIGVNLSNSLVAAGARVYAFGHRIAVPHSLHPDVRWTAGDIGDRTALINAVSNADFLFHLAGTASPAIASVDPANDILTHLVSTVRMLDVARSCSVGRIVYISSGGTVYGEPPVVPIPEDVPTNPITAYAVQKLAIEKYLSVYHHLYGVDYCILRVANPYGPFQLARNNQGVVAAFIRRALASESIVIWGSGENVRDFIHIDDVVRAIMMAASHEGPRRLYNVGSGEGITINRIADDIERIVGLPLKRIYREPRPFDLSSNILDIGRIRADLGWHPSVPWVDGLRSTVAWIRETSSRAAD